MKKEIIFLLTHKLNNRIVNNIHKIYQEKGEREFYVLVHGNLDFSNLPVPVRGFSLGELQSLNFEMLKNELVPGSAHMPLFHYFQEFPDYDYYWLVEYDVEFGGNWEFLFNTYTKCEADFISSYITPYEKEKDWPWWYLDHPQKKIPKSERIRSFNPIYRISKKAMQFLMNELATGWKGHNEVLLSTILHHNNFQLLDFGRDGEFSSLRYPNFYTSNFRFHKNTFGFFDSLKFGTMRYIPPMRKVGYRKLLYHPVKKETGITKRKEFVHKLKWFKKRMAKLLFRRRN